MLPLISNNDDESSCCKAACSPNPKLSMKMGEGKLFLVTLGKYCLTLSQAWKENLATHGRGRTFAPSRLQAALFSSILPLMQHLLIPFIKVLA